MKRAAVSFSFDDGRVEHAALAAPILEEFGIKATFYIVPGLMKEKASVTRDLWRKRIPVALMGWEDARRLVKAGHELGNHGMTHRKAYPPMTKEERYREIAESTRLITKKVGRCPRTWAWPHYRNEAVAGRMVLRYGMKHRPAGPRLSYNCGKGTNPMPLARMNTWVDKAHRAGTWVHAIIHAFDKGVKAVSIQRFEAHLRHVRQLGIEVVTVKEGLRRYG